MTELSKIVRERLRVKPATMADHPDADLLTAFAERSLTERDRAAVMQHLAHCGDCREVVALALPAEVEEVVVAKGGVRGNWFRLPALRWAAVAVGIAVAVSVGTLEYRKQSMRPLGANVVHKEEKRETVATLTQSPLAFESQAKTAAPPPETSDKRLAKQAVGAASGSAAKAWIAGPSHAFSTGASHGSAAGIGGGSGADMGVAAAPTGNLARTDAAKSSPPSQAASAQAAVPAPSRLAVPAVSESVEVSAAAGPVETEQAEMGTDKEVVGKAKPTVSRQIVSGASASSSPIQGRNMVKLQEPPSKDAPHWTIAANGALERSFDGGTTWQDVNVTGEGSTGANFMLRARTADTAKSAERKPAEKQSPTATPLFRAVAANGTEVWAGGSGGALYHTMDAGNSWARVVPSFEGIVLGGDISSIEFSDSQHGRISTSTGEIWTTGDGGQTWLKLQ
jgi:Photosynthesis system II assembly factor YCF48/Putative zinc-finger